MKSNAYFGFNPPEGIIFDPEGSLYISNEGERGKPNLLFFPYLGES